MVARALLAVALLTVGVLLAGCGAPPTATTSSAVPNTSPATVATTPVPSSPCRAEPAPQSAAAWPATAMGGDVDPVAHNLAELLGDSVTDRVSPATIAAGSRPNTALWNTHENGRISLQKETTPDETLPGAYWPAETWTYTSPRIWPGLDNDQNNATFLHAVASLSAIAPEQFHATYRVETNESETEYPIHERVGDLPLVPIARARVMHKTTVNLTQITFDRPVQFAPSFHPMPFVQLNATAGAAADCWAKANLPGAPLLLQIGSATHLLNGTMVAVFGFTDPAARGKAACFDGRVLSVQVDAITGTVRAIRARSNLKDCL